MRRFLPIFALLCGLALLLAAGCDRQDKPATTKAPLAPDFTLRDLAGQEVNLAAYRGKVVFLNFWASWCPPCRSEMPSMERLNEAFGARNFVMLAVSADDDINELRGFLAQNPHRFTVLFDGEQKAQKLYNVSKFPETFILDRDGRMIEHIVGARDWSSPEALQYFQKLVDGK